MSEESKFVPLTEISQGGSWADDQEEPTTQPEPKARSVWGKVQDVQAIDIAKLAEDDKKAKAEAAENSQWTQVNQPGARRPPGSGRTEGGSYNRDGGSSYNRDNFNRDGGSGGYNRDNFNRDGGSSYNRGSFNRDGGSGGFNRDGGSGGFNRDGGGYGESRAPREKQAPPDSPPFQAFVGNLAFEVTEDTLADYFGELGVSSVRIVRDEGGRSKGFGYVEFNTKDGLVNALAADKAELNGRGMNVDVASAKPQRERTKLEWGHSGDGPRNSFGGDRERNDRGFGERGFGGDRDRGFGGDRDRSFGGDRDRGFGGGDRGGRSFGSDFQRNAPPAERPRVNVAPRSQAPPASAPASSLYGIKSENPFGAAMSDVEKQNKAAQDRLKREKEKEEAEKKRREEIERRAKEESDRPKGGFGDGRGWRGGGGDAGSPQRNGSGARGGSSAGSGGRGGSSVGRGGGAGDRGDRGDRGGRGGGRGGRGGSSAEERGRRWDNEEGGEQTQPQQRKEKPAPYVKEEKGPAKPSNPYDLLSVEGGAGDEEGDQ